MLVLLIGLKLESDLDSIGSNLVMTRNARRQSRRPRYKTVAHVPDFDTLVPAPELSLPIQLCRHISKGIIFCIRERQLWSGNESVEIRYVNGSFVAGTSASSPGVPRHMYVLFIHYKPSRNIHLSLKRYDLPASPPNCFSSDLPLMYKFKF